MAKSTDNTAAGTTRKVSGDNSEGLAKSNSERLAKSDDAFILNTWWIAAGEPTPSNKTEAHRALSDPDFVNNVMGGDYHMIFDYFELAEWSADQITLWMKLLNRVDSFFLRRAIKS